MNGCKEIPIREFLSEQGTLCVAESGVDVEFDFKRIFYIYGEERDSVRGEHANIDSSFLMFAINGSCKVLVDNGKEKQTFDLSTPEKAILLEKCVWKEMFEFSKDCILVVLSNQNYNPQEYIYDYNEFLKLRNSN